jgi:hypothetical protein
MISNFRGVNFFLSNFYPCRVFFEGMVWKSSEHAYQAAKTTDVDQKRLIQSLDTAEEAKRITRTIVFKNKFQRHDWDEIKLAVMEEVLRSKFSNEVLQQLLLNTGKEELVEGNWWGDFFWGVCQGKGENNLGKLLMKLREEYRLAADVPF